MPVITNADASFPAIAAAIRAVYDDECAAMVRGDSVALDELLASDFTLTHMTGYVQQKGEWLHDVLNREMEYHSMEQIEVVVELEADQPVLTARTLTNATIWGMRGTWRLYLRNSFHNTDGEWAITRTVASVW